MKLTQLEKDIISCTFNKERKYYTAEKSVRFNFVAPLSITWQKVTVKEHTVKIEIATVMRVCLTIF